MTDRIMLIANPTAGNGQFLKKWEKEIRPFLKSLWGDFDCLMTHQKGDASVFCRQSLRSQYDLIVCVGGDGTLNEIVNGFFDEGIPVNPEAALAVLPFGSGSDFARTLKMARSLTKAAWQIKNGTKTTIDLAQVTFTDPVYTPKYFINILEAGLGSVIMSHVNTMAKSTPPLLKYLKGTFLGMRQYSRLSVKLFLDNQAPQNFALTDLIIANGRHFGCGMRPAPEAKIDDGLLDIVVVRHLSFGRFLKLAPRLYWSKKNIKSSGIEYYQATSCRVELDDSDQILKTEMDGETYGQGNFMVKILPGAIKILV